MRSASVLACVAALSMSLLPVAAHAQAVVTMTGSPLPDQPFTLIHPAEMIVSGGPGEPVTINHPAMPLQCILRVVPVEDTGWTAEGALAALDEAAVTQGWGQSVPGFALTSKSTTAYQSNAALRYEGGNQGDEAVTVVHTETVDTGNGYTLDCIYGNAAAEQARPLVDYIIANFSTKQDAQPITTLQ